MRRPPEGDSPFGESEAREYLKAQSTEPVRTSSCRMVTSEDGGCFTRTTGWVVPVLRAAKSQGGGALIGNVARLWCSGRQHAIFVFVSPCRRAGNATPDVGPRNPPLPEADGRPLQSEKRCAL